MTGGEIGTILAVVTAFVSGMYGTWRFAKKDRLDASGSNVAAVIAGYDRLAARSETEQDRAMALLRQQIADLKAEHETDRAEWSREREQIKEEARVERSRLQAEIDILRQQVVNLIERAR